MLLVTCCGAGGRKGEREIIVYVATSLTDVLKEAASAFTRESGINPGLEFASSGSLARKIEAGAPTDLYISANKKWIDYLDERRIISSVGRKILWMFFCPTARPADLPEIIQRRIIMFSRITRRSFIKNSSLAAAGGALFSTRCNTCETAAGKILEPVREVPIAAHCDICVVGGSCTGVFAAVAAARLGAEVSIVENNGFFGGVATASLVNIWHSPFDTEEKGRIIAGLTNETVERLKRRNALQMGKSSYSFYRLATEELKIELDELVIESGARPFLHAFFVAPVMGEDQSVKAVIIEDKSGRRAITASYFIDATGDGDLIARMGLPFYKDDNIQPPTTCAILRGLGAIKEKHPDFDIGKVAFDPGYQQALKRGFLWGAPVPGSGDDYMLAGTRVFGADCSDADQLTASEIEGRRQVRAICDILRENFLPDWLNPLVELPAKIGIRESRHARCIHQLKEKEVLNGKRFPDAIANGSYRVDIHLADREGLIFRYLDGTEVFAGVDGKREEGRWREETGENPTFYQIPYRSLVPQGAANVLVTGRAIDADRGAFGAIRVMVNCNQTGEAAGTAAYLALDSNKPLPEIDTGALRKTLKDHGALII